MHKQRKTALRRAGRLLALTAAPVLLLLAAAGLRPEGAGALYLVEESGYVHVDEMEGDVFLTDGSSSLLSIEDGSTLRLTRGVKATVRYQERTVSAVTRDETVDALLSRLNIHPSPLEMIAISNTDDALDIEVGPEFIFYERLSQVTEHEIIYRENNKKPAWDETVLQEGRDGEYTEVYEIIYEDGQEVSRQLIEVVDTEPVPAIIERGTVENFANNADPVASIETREDGTGTITLENGQVLTFSEVKNMTGTAYTRSEGWVGEITASGTAVHVGIVAVDRKVIPLGTKVYVVSSDGQYLYGFAVAEDTGVRGNSIDLYMDTYEECIQFGRRACTVYILD